MAWLKHTALDVLVAVFLVHFGAAEMWSIYNLYYFSLLYIRYVNVSLWAFLCFLCSWCCSGQPTDGDIDCVPTNSHTLVTSVSVCSWQDVTLFLSSVMFLAKQCPTKDLSSGKVLLFGGSITFKATVTMQWWEGGFICATIFFICVAGVISLHHLVQNTHCKQKRRLKIIFCQFLWSTLKP